MIVYHWTPTSNAPDILQHGLLPGSCLARSPSSWLWWAVRCARESDEQWTLMQIDVAGRDLEPTLSPAEYMEGSAHGRGDELRCGQEVTPDRVIGMKRLSAICRAAP